jgi:hypothetical protein
MSDPTPEPVFRDVSDEVTREDAETAGSDAYKAGLPYDAPSYRLGIRQASWRIGWKREQAAAGQAGTMEHIFTPTPGWLAEEAEHLRPRIAEMLAERQRAAALDAIHTEFGGHPASMAVAIYELRRRVVDV